MREGSHRVEQRRGQCVVGLRDPRLPTARRLSAPLARCTADAGWITGHSFLAYGPMLRGATVVVFGSTPAYPDPGRCWRIVEKYRVRHGEGGLGWQAADDERAPPASRLEGLRGPGGWSTHLSPPCPRHDPSLQVRQFFTAPTLIRALMQHGDGWVTKHDRSSLRMLGTAGEPINPHAWQWYHQVRLAPVVPSPMGAPGCRGRHPARVAARGWCDGGWRPAGVIRLLPAVRKPRLPETWLPLGTSPCRPLTSTPPLSYPPSPRWWARAAAPSWTLGGR